MPELYKLKNDILILGGTDDPEHPLASTIKMNDALTNAKLRLEIMEGAGDPVYRDFPRESHQIISDFIAEK